MYVAVGSGVGIVVYILTIVLIGLVISLKIKGTTYIFKYNAIHMQSCLYIQCMSYRNKNQAKYYKNVIVREVCNFKLQ